jgi:hypothetical protein
MLDNDKMLGRILIGLMEHVNALSEASTATTLLIAEHLPGLPHSQSEDMIRAAKHAEALLENHRQLLKALESRIT